MNTIATDVEPVDSLDRFVRETRETGTQGERFESESARMLRIDVDCGVWLKPGAAVAYRGEIKFQRLPTIEARSLPDAVLRETSPLVRATGTGRLYCAHHGLHLHLVRLRGETINVVWQDLVAFEESLAFRMALVGHGLGLAAGGLVTVKLSGHGALALAAHGKPLTLPVRPDAPVSTDPHATMAWSGSLTPTLKTDLSWRSALGHGGHEPIQMFFEGTGFVVVQPYEDPSRLRLNFNPLNQIKSLVPA